MLESRLRAAVSFPQVGFGAMTNPGQERTKAELRPFPRGPRGSGQNLFRALLWMLFRNFYSSKRSERFESRESIFAYAIAKVREFHPNFWPETV
jgi:hypothetical protein